MEDKNNVKKKVKKINAVPNEETEKLEHKEVKLYLANEDYEKLKKIAEEDFSDLDQMIIDSLEKKVQIYDETGFECNYCHKFIKENENYYVQEGSVSKYEKIGGTIYEDKLDAWTDKILCMDCKTKIDVDKEKVNNSKVRNYARLQPSLSKVSFEQNDQECEVKWIYSKNH